MYDISTTSHNKFQHKFNKRDTRTKVVEIGGLAFVTMLNLVPNMVVFGSTLTLENLHDKNTCHRQSLTLNFMCCRIQKV